MIVTELDYAYIAGLIDGEGSICICKNVTKTGKPSHILTVNIANTDRAMLDYVKNTMGVGTVAARPTTRYLGTFGTKQQYQYSVTSTRALGFLAAIAPYLKLKRQRAALGILFQCRKRNARRARLGLQLDEINRRESIRIRMMALNA